MQTTQTITLPPQATSAEAQTPLRLRSDPPQSPENLSPDFQPVIDRLRIIYLKYSNNNDELSYRIQEISERFLRTDFSQTRPFSEVIRIAQDCRNQFAETLRNDFDQAPVSDELVEIRGWRFARWQLEDFTKLDKLFGQRQVALSPFDNLPIPENAPRHEFAQAIIDLMKTIPQFLQETNNPPPSAEPQAPVSNQQLIPLTLSGNGNGLMVQQDAVNFTPELNLIVAFQRHSTWKKLASATVQERKFQRILVQVEADREARRQENENYLQQIIREEAQRLQAYFEERQQVVQERIEEAEQARAEIGRLNEQLEVALNNINKLREDLAQEEKRSASLQQQLYVEQANYHRLAQEIHELRQRCKKRPWWKFW